MKIVARIVLRYLQFLTRLYIKRYNPEIIGLTGSVGKSTLTVAIHSILSTKYKVGMTFRHGHGLNSESGIPFAILDVPVDRYGPFDWIRYLFAASLHFIVKKPTYEKFIIEMGVDKPGDMEFSLGMAKPKTGVFLSISKMHTENFMTEAKKRKVQPIDVLFDEKALLIKSLSKDDWAVLNADDKKIRLLSQEVQGHSILFGQINEADILGSITSISENEFKGIITFQKKSFPITVQKYFVNGQMFMTLLAAVAVGTIYNIPIDTSISILENLKPPPGRMSKIEGIRNTVIIDSSYNASRAAMFEALDNLALFKDRTKIAVLGDMRELGSDSRGEHEQVAEKAVKIADMIVTIGPQMKNYFMSTVIQKGFDTLKTYSFDNTWKALDFIKNNLIKGGEAILVKGSQNTLFLEIIVEGLMKDPSKAEELLCRRGKFWDEKRTLLKL
jgi:UDP-N-acetylmuramoyl-tripeptide--D-alanyl-D-alanine ligase